MSEAWDFIMMIGHVSFWKSSITRHYFGPGLHWIVLFQPGLTWRHYQFWVQPRSLAVVYYCIALGDRLRFLVDAAPGLAWPGKREVGWMALLMAVYPGFMQQSISIAYQQHFTCYALFTLSLGFMAWGMRKPKWFWVGMVLSLITSTVQLLTMEYFVGLELIRPVLIWVMLRYPQDKIQTTLVKTLRNWAPYLLPIGIFLYYRLVLFGRLSPDPSFNAPIFLKTLTHAPLAGVIQLLQTSLQDFHDGECFCLG